MNRIDTATSKEYPVFFTEKAYNLYKNDQQRFEETAMIRLVRSYKTLGENSQTVFLARLPEEKGESNLHYYSEEQFEYRIMCEHKRSRVSSGIKRRK